MANLGDMARASYQESFAVAVAEQRAQPMVFNYTVLLPSFLPALWLAIPHTKRPWLYQTRWLVVAFVVAFNINTLRFASSGNVASAYGAGLMSTWQLLSMLHFLVWSRPQFDAARAVKISRSGTRRGTKGASKRGDHGPQQNGLRQRVLQDKPPSTPGSAVVDDVRDDEPEWVWQPFPEDAPFSQRLNWAFDLTSSFRSIGWNHAITSVPLPEIPVNIRPGDPVIIDSMPRISRSGYRRSLTEREFVWTRLRSAGLMYLTLDFLSVFMMKDPYFIFGPDHGLELPALLQSLPPWLLLTYRELFSVAGVIAAIDALFNLHDLFQYYVFSYIFPIRGELWQYTTIFGSFSQVLDRGLAGWWGSWWHQTFRGGFMAPSAYLIKHGYLDKRSILAKIVVVYVSFIQSGLLHASGSATSMRETKLWRAPLFFFLQATGIVVQDTLAFVAKKYLPRLPRRLSQACNLLSSLLWLQITARPLVDDFASSGLWLLEPVPISLLRWMGFGHPDDYWWRWNRVLFPSWYSGRHWWESGTAI
ncbi:hypothetical protein G7046_g1965 [Stylonectria norvegica]|nr:hypothetical protein G7046_g1965 [Stylonectria norvegica]